jgi:DnaJ-domain-containing protein 1
LFWRPSTAKNIFRRLPWQIKVIAGPVFGGLAGLLGGVAGVIIGIILGYLLQELFGQFRSDREILNYFENPGRSGFYEGEPGLAAFCALGILIVARPPDFAPSSGPGSATDGEATAREVSRKAAAFFPGNQADASLIEHFCRLAWSRRYSLNPDLLTESLMARRGSGKDLPELGRALYELASGEKSLDLARYIRTMLDPGYNPRAEADEAPQAPEQDPWKILGLPPGTPIREVKSSFRKLAIRFHPDSLRELDKEQQKTAAETFIAIEEAYRKIVTEKKNPR